MDDDSPQNGNELDQMLYDVEDNFKDDRAYSKFVALLEDSEKPLYTCSKYTKLSVVLELLRVKASGGWSDKSFTSLLGLLCDMLPKGNLMPEDTYRAKKVLCPLGLQVEKIHACKNDCILYRKEYADLRSCPL